MFYRVTNVYIFFFGFRHFSRCTPMCSNQLSINVSVIQCEFFLCLQIRMFIILID